MRRNLAMELASIGVVCLISAASARSEDPLTRAGCPQFVSKRAQVGYGDKYIVYYVGGGASVRKGSPRECTEGTFGVDYQPIVPGFRQATALRWWHGRRLQGGPGQYEPNERVKAFPNWRHEAGMLTE